MKSSLWWLLRLTPLASLTYISLTKALISPLQTQNVASREIWYFGDDRPDRARPGQTRRAPLLSRVTQWLGFINYFPSGIVCVCEPHLVYEYLDCMKYAGEAALQQCAAVMALLTITERGRMIYYRRVEGGVLVSISASQPLTSVLLLRLRTLAMAVWGKYRAKSQLLKDFILKWQPHCNDN